MNYLIIAAGEGSRLRSEGVEAPKPMINLDGRPMIGRLASMMCSTPGAESLGVIVNEEMAPEVGAWLQAQQWPVPFRLTVKSTPSSMHSFYELSRVLPQGRLVLTTVDTIIRRPDFEAFAGAWTKAPADVDGMMALTPWVDDEKPLWVTVRTADGSMDITGFHDSRPEPLPAGEEVFVSGGIYGLTAPAATDVLAACLKAGTSRMRNYQRALVAAGLRLKAFVVDKIMDVDHASDIEKARKFIEQN